MIFVDGLPFPNPAAGDSRSFQGHSQRQRQERGREILASLLEHPALIASWKRFLATTQRKVSLSDASPPLNLVYVFQREYATVDPALVQLVGTDEATTCLGVVIRNRNNGLISVSHMDFPGVVDHGLNQMLSSLVNSEADLDVHLIGGFDDALDKHLVSRTGQRKLKPDGYSLPLCAKIIEALHFSQRNFHVQTLCVLQHNTRTDSYKNALPIVGGFLVDTTSGSIMPASFDRSSRGPDEIVRRIRVTVSSYDPNWEGRLLETYDTHHDKFNIAPCSWVSDWAQYASSLQQLSDSEMLLKCSTSPYAEDPDFVVNQRRICNYLITNPDWLQTYIGNRARTFKRTLDGKWLQCE